MKLTPTAKSGKEWLDYRLTQGETLVDLALEKGMFIVDSDDPFGIGFVEELSDRLVLERSYIVKKHITWERRQR